MTKDEALKLALEALEWDSDFDKRQAARAAVKQALAAPVQEPCQYAVDVAMPEHRCVGKCQYAAQRPWVGLTDDEINNCCDFPLNSLGMKHVRKIEAKLKEKNT